MTCSCNSMCYRMKSEPVRGFHTGQKYCSVCRIYITTNSILCLCCHKKYRVRKRSRWKQTATKICESHILN